MAPLATSQNIDPRNPARADITLKQALQQQGQVGVHSQRLHHRRVFYKYCSKMHYCDDIAPDQDLVPPKTYWLLCPAAVHRSAGSIDIFNLPNCRPRDYLMIPNAHRGPRTCEAQLMSVASRLWTDAMSCIQRKGRVDKRHRCSPRTVMQSSRAICRCEDEFSLESPVSLTCEGRESVLPKPTIGIIKRMLSVGITDRKSVRTPCGTPAVRS